MSLDPGSSLQNEIYVTRSRPGRWAPRAEAGRGEARSGAASATSRAARAPSDDAGQPRGVRPVAAAAPDAAGDPERDPTTVLGHRCRRRCCSRRSACCDRAPRRRAGRRRGPRPPRAADRPLQRRVAPRSRTWPRRWATRPRWYQLYWRTTASWPRASSAGPRRPATGRSWSRSTPACWAGGRATCSRPTCRSSRAGIANYFTDPVFRAALRDRRRRTRRAPCGTSLGIFANPALTWDDLAWLREQTRCRWWSRASCTPTTPGARRRAASTASSSPTTAAGRSTARSPRSTRCRRWRTAVGGRVAGAARLGRAHAAPTCQGLALGAGAVGSGRPYVLGAGGSAARRASSTCCALLAELDLTMALAGAALRPRSRS